MKKMKFNVKGAQKIQSQRNDLKFEFPAGLEELTAEETKRIVGGESLAYWLGYSASKIVQFFS